MRKIILFTLLCVGLFGCECFRSDPFWGITDFNLHTSDFEPTVPENGILKGDSIQITVVFGAEFLATSTSFSNPFMNRAYATTCAKSGLDGMLDPVIEFDVTSSGKFKNIEAGESLNTLIFSQGYGTIDKWVSESATWAYPATGNLIITQRPDSASVHIFKVRIETESGKVFTKETEEIQWN